MSKIKFFIVLLLTQCVIYCGFAQDKKETLFTKYTFKAYMKKSEKACEKLQKEFHSKNGIQFVLISEKDESVVIANQEIKFKDISEVARLLDCKLEKLSETEIDQDTLEKYKTKFNTIKQ